MTKLLNRLGSVTLLAFAPAAVLADEAAEKTGTTGLGARGWFWAVIAIVAVGILFARYRTYRVRHGPHGPQSPTPRGP